MRYLIIDSNNLLYRAHYVSDLRDSNGNRVSGVFNSLKMIQTLMKKFKPDRIIMAWDGGKSKERLSLYPDYKAQRDAKRNEDDKISIMNQREKIKEICSYLPIIQIEVDGIEADDIIGYLTGNLKGVKIIVSNDQDFLQLVKDKTYLFLPNKMKVISKKNIEKYLGFPVKHYVLWKCLVGDSSDNIKGVKGIGPKRATAIILNGIKSRKKLPINTDEMKILNRNKYLITIGALLSDDQKKIIKYKYKASKKYIKDDYKKVKSIFRKMNFKYLLYDFDYYWIHNFKKIRKSLNECTKEKRKVKKE